MGSLHEERSDRTRTLSARHRRTLEVESAIAPEVWQASGARTVTRGRELPKPYSRRQRARAPGMLFDGHHHDGSASTIFRPDKPRADSPGHRYEQPPKRRGGAGNVLGIHPWQRELGLWERSDVPVWIVEGQKKLLAVVSALWRARMLDAVLVVSVSGTWNWLSDHKVIAHLRALPLSGRKACVWYDSDLCVKWQVRDAANELCRYLDGRGAEVEVVVSPAMPDGSKRGADDHLAAGGTLDEAAAWSERWTPETFAGDAMMQRSPELRDAVERAKRLLWDRPPGGRGDPSDFKIIRALVERSPERGKVLPEDPEWMFVDVSRREVIDDASVSSATLYKRGKRLEAHGVMRMGKRKTGRAASGFYLYIGERAKVKHNGTDSRLTQQSNEFRETLYTSVLPLRAPALRASSPGWKPTLKRIEHARKNNTTLPDPRPPIRRPGPRVGQALAVLDVCQQAGYIPTDAEVAAALGIPRVRDYRRRYKYLHTRTGEAKEVLGTGTKLLDYGLADGRNILAPDWLEALELIREHGDEQEQGRRVRELHAAERAKYRARIRQNRHKPREQYPRASEAGSSEASLGSDPRVARLVRTGMRRDLAESATYHERRREHIERAVAALFAERPEYRARRAGQIVCQLPDYLAPDFPRGELGLPKDAEVAALLDGVAA